MKTLRNLLLALCLAIPAMAWAATVDINRADAATLAAELDGIGQVRAQAIVAYREAHGPFTSVDELLRVKGVGRRVLEANRERMRVGGEEPPG